MRWWHAAIIGAGLLIGGLLAGGVYDLRLDDGTLYRINRLTGTVDTFEVSEHTIGWYRLPTDVDYFMVDNTKILRRGKATP